MSAAKACGMTRSRALLSMGVPAEWAWGRAWKQQCMRQRAGLLRAS
jgi:hypothetical protein